MPGSFPEHCSIPKKSSSPFPSAGCLIESRVAIMEDNELLREYANQNSEAAFRELVNRHMNLLPSNQIIRSFA